MRKLGLVVAGVAALGMALGQNVIKIATQSPLSGPQAALGEQIKLGAELAVEEAKARFRQLGFDLQLVPYDDQANPDVGVANANRIINDPDILGVVGHLNSGVAIPSSEVYARVNLVMVSPANTNPRVTDRKLPNVNRICGRDDVQGPAGAEYAFNNLGVRTVFVIHDKTAYGQGLAEEFKKRFEALGGRAVAFVGTEETSNFVPIINQIRGARPIPQLIYFGGIYSQIGPFVKQLRERGLTTRLMGGDGLDSSEFERLAGSQAAKGTYYTTVAGPVSAFPKARALAQRFKQRFGKEIEGFGVYAYDSANVILTALENAIKANGGRKPTREQVAKAVREVKLEGVTGTIEFDEKGDIKKAKYFIMQVAGTGNWADNKLIRVVEVAAPAAR
ncbi:branched-chain amino acid ABC transporter substrate-binding protein [Thermus oshimai]|jgi:branched-chain amino acid transport system substrate-binding protein|uniref:ABC-type branched-chain amino acid transport system, periplasmic component n=1 Tax=Thermus oshimai JL-2 TaxID=751945 RepID=K7QW00_THEOS|nr:branched-chain amino acid ABC transporter substrate-binding protein [Thermus oshimai]AFV75578.1 ABC-type branched-chain amino acid transport system, periplasmic component [Thermus oshimai JL-2]